MTRTAELEQSRLTVLLDVRHPLAYLALGPATALGKAEGIEINWLPLATPPLHAPTTPSPTDDRSVRHRRYRATAIAREVAVYARAQNLLLRDYYRAADADAAHLGWLWIRDRYPDRLGSYLHELFRSYWALELDASSTANVATLLEAIQTDGAGFRAWAETEGRAAATALDAELRTHGLFGVPAYVLEDEVFYGRQHLPMIRWILGDRQGPGPI